MANPQKENGFTPIANEILDKLVNTALLGAEFQIIILVLRKTYGFQKKEDWISLTQFEKLTGLSRPTVVKTLKNLVFRNLLKKTKDCVYSFNKDWETWVVNTALLVKNNSPSSKHRLTDTSKHRLTHKRNYQKKTKENSTFLKRKDAPLKDNKKTMKNTWKYNEKNSSDTFEDVIDLETGEAVKPKEPKRQKAINYIKDYFSSKCEKELKIKPVLTYKQNIIIANLFNKNKMKPSEITSIIDWWFDTEQDKAKLIHIGFCLNATTINNYKVAKNL